MDVNVPIFLYKRHAALALAKDLAQLHRNILNELCRLGFSDYSFGAIGSERWFDKPLTTMPPEFIDLYKIEDFFSDDQVVGYLSANSRPAYRTTIEKYIQSSPVKTKLFERNQELNSVWRNFGFLECYLIPIDKDDGSTFTVSVRYETPEQIQSRVEMCRKELIALGKVIRHVCQQKFSSIFRLEEPEPASISINRRPLEVIKALANGCPTVYAVAAELGLSINTVNHHIATAKEALGATSLPHAVAIAIRAELV